MAKYDRFENKCRRKREREKEREKWSTTATATSRAAPTQVNGDCNRVLFNKKRERERDKCKSIRREGKTVYLHIPAPYKCNLNEFVPWREEYIHNKCTHSPENMQKRIKNLHFQTNNVTIFLQKRIFFRKRIRMKILL